MSGMKLPVVLVILIGACRASGESPPNDDMPDALGSADAGDDVDAPPPRIDAPPGTDYCNATDPRDVPVVVAPTPESGEAPYVDVLATATTSIDVSIYLMGYGGILDQLKAKASAGVQVRVILDQYQRDTNQQYYDQ